MVPHTQIPDDKTSYGALLAVASKATAAAGSLAPSTFSDPRQAADVLVDFERFLGIGGRHLTLLLAPRSSRGSGIRQAHRDAARRLAELPMERRGDSLWAEAGDRLGLAHDVFATHLSPAGQTRSSEVEVLLEPGVQAAAVARMLTLLDAPLASAGELATRVRSSQPRREPFFSHSRAFRLRQLVHAARLNLAAAPSLGVVPEGAVLAVDGLRPAVTSAGTAALDGDDLGGLRLLRQLSYRQSQGEERANTHTLSELCVLGAVASRTARQHLPLAHSPLDRVRRADAIDRLSAAETAWTELRRHLFPRVQGLAKAPPLYRDAIAAVTSDAKRSPAITEAVLSALPRLAIDAGRTVVHLQGHGDLVWCGRRPGELTSRWHPLDATQARSLANRFAAVGRTSQMAFEVWRQSPGAPVRVDLSDVPTARRLALQLGATS